MIESWSLERILAVDRIAMENFAMPGAILMENAGRGAADWIVSHVPSAARVVVLCGTGNNGGDGLVIARHLNAAHLAVEVWMIGDKSKMTSDTHSNYAILSNTQVPCRWIPLDAKNASIAPMEENLAQADIVIDALLGTGSKGPPRGAMAAAIRAANQSAAQRFAIDIPSGLDGSSGTPNSPTFRAQTTLTFVASKTGFDSPNALPYVGQVLVFPIGVPSEVIDRACEVCP